jgi:pentose-5-phosphate-3-epimerase
VAELRAANSDLEISLDGGASVNTIAKICATDLDIAYTNTAIFGSEDPLTSYSQMMEQCGI